MDGLASAGPIVCACFGVGRTTICDAIASGAGSSAEIGARLKAGTDYGKLVHSGIETPAIAQAGTVPARNQPIPNHVDWWLPQTWRNWGRDGLD